MYVLFGFINNVIFNKHDVMSNKKIATIKGCQCCNGYFQMCIGLFDINIFFNGPALNNGEISQKDI